MSMDDNDLDADIGMIEQDMLEKAGDEEALQKLNKSKDLLMQRKTILQLKNDICNMTPNSVEKLDDSFQTH